MKKAYTSPRLYAERFSLAEHIANCNTIAGANSGSASTCTFVIGNDNFFTDVNICDGELLELFTDNGILPDPKNLPQIGLTCYNNMTDAGSVLFRS